MEEKTTTGISYQNNLSVIGKAGVAGITLVALVVTVIILLILAGVSITQLTGDRSVVNEAKDARNSIENTKDKTLEGLGELSNSLKETYGEVKLPEGLDVGSTVKYNPSGTYNWQAKYCSSTKTETTDDVLLDSSKADFNISEWKVLSIDENTGKIELVPSSPTTGTVYLGEAQGYNNGVKLLNDACSNLYGNNAKKITARSINIDDIEKYMTGEALTGPDGAHNYINTSSNTKYGDQVSSSYTIYKYYPVIYAKEHKAVINGSTPEGATLDLSDTLDRFMERTENRSNRWKINSNY